MPLFCIGIELIHVIRSAIRVCPSKQVEDSSVLYNSMPSSWSVNYFVIIKNIIFIYSLILDHYWTWYLRIYIMLSPTSNILTILPFLTLLIINILFRYHSLPFMESKVLIKLFEVEVWIWVDIRIIIHIIWIYIIQV